MMGKSVICSRLFAIAAVVLVLAAAPVHADIVLDKAFPTVKQSSRLHVIDAAGASVAGAKITVTYRPESAVERESVVGETAADGTFDWTPTEAGIVTIAAAWRDEDGTERATSVNASVKFDPTPIAGIVIMLFAGIVLIGGGVERIFALLRAPEEE